MLLGLVFGLVAFFMPDIWVGVQRDKRQVAMRLAAADTIDQLTICVEAGPGLRRRPGPCCVNERWTLPEELQHTVTDVRAGVPRPQALRTLADRSQIVEIRQLVTALLQAQKHGVPLAETLRIQSAEMRVRQATD